MDGRLVAAINEERLSRRKLEIRFPSASIHACLELANVRPRDVTLVAGSTTDPAKTVGRLMPWTKERYYAVRRRKTRPGMLSYLTQTAKRRMTEWRPTAISRHLSAVALRRELAGTGLEAARLRLFDHHYCHALTAAYASGFDACTVVTIDGLGDGLSASVSDFSDGRLRLRATSPARDSLGVFFEHVTHLLNMRELEDEGKVMALADYAAPVPDSDNPLLSLFSVDGGRLRSRVAAHALERPLRRILWSRANEEFAFLGQRTIEHVCTRLVRSAVQLTGCPRVALAGGVASNVKANRLMRLIPEVDDIYVFPHMGDGGLALGAALAGCLEQRSTPGLNLDSLALGQAFTDWEIAQAAQAAGLSPCVPHDLPGEVGDRLAQGQIVCWFQGRMEFGPRALGNRSVLAQPDRPDLRDRLNLILKRRVWYQPFCPSLLESEASRLLADWTMSGRSNRHMTMAYMVAPAWRGAMAGVISTDGTCRPQVVDDQGTEAFAAVLRALRARLGVGAVLNTSFNIHGEPLVCSPGEAFSVFHRSGADALAIGPFLVERPAQSV